MFTELVDRRQSRPTDKFQSNVWLDFDAYLAHQQLRSTSAAEQVPQQLPQQEPVRVRHLDGCLPRTTMSDAQTSKQLEYPLRDAEALFLGLVGNDTVSAMPNTFRIEPIEKFAVCVYLNYLQTTYI